MSAPDPEVERHLRELEERLLTRAEPGAALGALLADDFVEFGSSGRVYRRADVIETLAAEEGTALRRMSAFHATELAPGVVLVTYRASRSTEGDGATAHSLRCSVWRQAGGEWRMVFHQGTPTPPLVE